MSAASATPDPTARTYADAMKEAQLRKEEVLSLSLPPSLSLFLVFLYPLSSLPPSLSFFHLFSPCICLSSLSLYNISHQREVREAIIKKASRGELPAASKPERKRKRWDQQTPTHDGNGDGGGARKKSAWDQAEVSLSHNLLISLCLYIH